ncbi:MAG TPA: right-handed parallel beta-helix repeat-containing protein, partial [Candidatus Saccharibacteria bacterium]|nr:right-handed parallel beta-helix repeat-containing protein [Candidatus Saccharibacteria bacterium]
FKPQRAIAATYTVTNNNDSGAGSLRQAILDANSNPGADIIVFDNAYTIQPTSALPNITDEVEINGYTGSPGGATPNTAISPEPFNGTITVELDGSLAGSNITGIVFDTGSDGSSVRGLAINRYDFDGIGFNTGSNITIAGNYIGTDTNGTTDLGNAARGVGAIDGDNIVVGGTNPEDRNIISGNDDGGGGKGNEGIAIGATCDGWKVQGNYIGLDATGLMAIPNEDAGVGMNAGSTTATIGGTTTGSANVISGNGGSGMYVMESSTVQGNLIGTGYAGLTDLGNAGDGIVLFGDGNTVGGSTTAARNIVSGNNTQGISLDTANSNTISGNFIGTDINGTADIGNTSNGVYVLNSTLATIGGDSASERNIISGNNNDGVQISGIDSYNNTVSGNYIGTDVNGTTDLGNSNDGIDVQSSAHDNDIGGTTSEYRNIISGNNQYGVNLYQSGSQNTVQGNYIGTDVNGTADLGNSNTGIAFAQSSSNTIGGVDGVTLGGTCTGSCNVISGNGVDGIGIYTDSDSNVVEGNFVGVNVSGTASLGNSGNGVQISTSSASNIIGGTTTGARNVLSGNASSGVIAINAGTDNNVIQGNYIGTDTTGMLDLGNTTFGVDVGQGAIGNTVGGTSISARNVIAGNNNINLALGGENNTAQGNYIGLNAQGSAVIYSTANQLVTLGGDNNVFGGTTEGAGNYVAGGGGNGVVLSGQTPFGGASSFNNIVQGNCIGTNANCEYEPGFGNTNVGLLVIADTYNSQIGGIEPGAGNTIAGNGAGIGIGGIATYYPLGTSVLINSIYNNTGAVAPSGIAGGIDLFQSNDFVDFINIGVTPNDVNDIDYEGSNTGPNHYLNFPVLNSVSSTNGTATINYDLDINDSEAYATGYRVDFYANDSGDVSGHGQGQTHIGYDTVSGDVTGRQVNISLPAGVEGNKYITAITTMTTDYTDSGFGHSSEFAANIEASLVPASSNPAANVLATTGRNIKWIGLIAAVLLAIGGAGLFIARRKQKFLQK